MLVAILLAFPGSVTSWSTVGATPPADSETLSLPEGVTTDLLFLRGQEVNRRAALRITNGSGSSLLVTSAQLRSPLFEMVAAGATNVLIPAGRTLDVFVDYGPAMCPAADEPSLAALTVVIDGGQPQSGTVPVPDHSAGMRNGRECDQRYVTDRLSLSFGAHFRIEGDTAYTTLDVERLADDEPATIDYVRGTVTMGIEPEPLGPPVAELEPGSQATSIPVSLWVARCDEHAVIESKRNYHFRVWVTMGDVHQQLLIVQVPEGAELWHALEELMHECVTGVS